MDHFDRGGRRGHFCMLLLWLACLVFQLVASASEEEYPMLLEHQGSKDDLLDSRSALVSSLNRLLEQEENEKRGSSFYPLRGKKTTDVDTSILNHYQFMPDVEDKRSQFYPLRGKKIPSELKRASYFMPMRGRKDGGSNIEGEEYWEDNQDKRASSFMPMRGKKNDDAVSSSLQHYGKTGTYSSTNADIKLPSNSKYSMNRVKRMSYFVPPRTRNSRRFDSVSVTTKPTVENPKKRKVNATYTTHMQYKRSISFTPMRGRRLLSMGSLEMPDGERATSLLEKKHYSFMPMRGRRTSYYALKRPMSFFATRGKRMEYPSLDEFSELP